MMRGLEVIFQSTPPQTPGSAAWGWFRLRRGRVAGGGLFVVLESGELAAVRGDQIIQGAEAVGDFLLFGWGLWKAHVNT